jgi:hypothetical protein
MAMRPWNGSSELRCSRRREFSETHLRFIFQVAAGTESITINFLRSDGNLRDGHGTIQAKDPPCLVAQSATIIIAATPTGHPVEKLN